MINKLENPIFFRLAQSAVLASIMEVMAFPKPGNVTRIQAGQDATVNHFLVSSCALFPVYLEAVNRGKECAEGERNLKDLEIGLLVRWGIEQTRHWGIRTNTNLGIVLLTVPLLTATGMLKAKNPTSQYDPQNISTLLSKIIEASTTADSINIVKGIQLANPGGLGKTSKFDVNRPSVGNEIKIAEINLLNLFSFCADKDLICQEYTTGFQLILFEAVPKFEEFLEKTCFENAISLLFLYLLKEKLDSLILRKFGQSVAEEIRDKTAELFITDVPVEILKSPKLMNFDKELREKSINPGTLADLVAATIFCYFYKNLSSEGINIPFCEPSLFLK